MTDTATAIPLAARINGARPWIPNKKRTQDEAIEGTLVAVKAGTNDQGERYPIVIIDCGHDDGSLTAWHAQSAIAQRQLRELRPAQGEAIGVVAHAPRESKARKDANGNPVAYTNWTVYNPDEADKVVSEEWDTFALGDEPPGF